MKTFDQEKAEKASVRYFLEMAKLMGKAGVVEFDFCKSAVKLTGGGLYLVQIQHVTGPKLPLPLPKRRKK